MSAANSGSVVRITTVWPSAVASASKCEMSRLRDSNPPADASIRRTDVARRRWTASQMLSLPKTSNARPGRNRCRSGKSHRLRTVLTCLAVVESPVKATKNRTFATEFRWVRTGNREATNVICLRTAVLWRAGFRSLTSTMPCVARRKPKIRYEMSAESEAAGLTTALTRPRRNVHVT